MRISFPCITAGTERLQIGCTLMEIWDKLDDYIPKLGTS
jgi:hypothetical protein